MQVHNRPARDGGFTLIEVLVSLSLFTIVAVSSSIALVTSARYGESTDNRVVAAGLAAAQIQMSRAVPDPSTLTAGTDSIVQNGATFVVQRQISLTCLANGKRRITIKVTWGGIGAPVFADTVLAC